MEQLINIKKADFVLNEFYDIVKDNYINKKVIIQKKTFHYNYDKYVKNDTIPNANDTNFKSGIIIVHICFSNKCIELKFQVGGLQGNQSYIALRTRVISRYNNYYFTLHNYIKNNFQPFGDYSKDWTSFGKKFDGFPDIKSATNETFDNLKNLIETEEMQRILNTDYEPTIPLDYEIEDINRLLDEFYRVVRQAFNDKNVKIKNKCFSDHQCNHEYTTPDMHNENYDFDYGACNVIIAFKDKTINIRIVTLSIVS